MAKNRNNACMGNARDPENRSRKSCCCGGHQGKRGKKRRKRWSRTDVALPSGGTFTTYELSPETEAALSAPINLPPDNCR
jgi:hypothetical protein